MKIVKSIIKYFPFAAIIILNILAEASGFRMRNVLPFVIIITSSLAINLIIALLIKVKDYFLYGLTIVSFFAAFTVFVFPNSLGQLYIENIIVGLYLGLFLAAFFPPLFRIKPFTFAISEKNYPESVTHGHQFLKINLILNYIWAGLFALGMLLTIIPYHTDSAINTIIATFVPIAVQLFIGIPITMKLPDYLMQKVSGKQIIFKTVKDLFSSMPYGLNKEKSEGINTVIQFFLIGKEPMIGHLIISNQKCSYNEGEHSNPKTTIHCDSELWLRISNNEVSGDKAFINK